MKTKLSLTALCFAAALVSAYGQDKAEPSYTESFDNENCHFTNSTIHPYFFMRPGYQLTLRGVEDKDTVLMVITVTNELKQVGNVETRVLEEREFVNGKLVEVSKNYVAVCKESGSIFYFGEDVDVYRDGNVVSHVGSWLAVGDNKPGVLMPGMPMLGARYYQEMARGIAMDRAEIVSMTDSVTTPAGTFTNVLKILETTPYEPKDKIYKYYAPRVGLIKDEHLELIKYGFNK